jgi:hypothetical protein
MDALYGVRSIKNNIYNNIEFVNAAKKDQYLIIPAKNQLCIVHYVNYKE